MPTWKQDWYSFPETYTAPTFFRSSVELDTLPPFFMGKGWVAVRDLLKKALGNPQPSPGNMIVYRVGSGEKVLAGRNAGNLEGVIAFLDQQGERGIAHGNLITALEVKKPPQFGTYQSLTGGKRVLLDGPVSVAPVGEFPGTAQIRERPLSAHSALYTRIHPTGVDTFQQFTQDGAFTGERVLLHDAIRKGLFAGKTVADKPVSIILGGGPASGKSTLTDKGYVKVPTNTVKIDPDAVKGQLPEYKELLAINDDNAAAFAHEESSVLSKRWLGESARFGYNTLFDGTGDGSLDGLKDKIDALRSRGQRIVGHYVTVPTNEAVRRATKRANETGRKVPEAQIRKTHKNVSKVVPLAIRDGLFDEFTLWDNTKEGGTPVVIARAEGKQLMVKNQKLWREFLAKAEE